MSKWHENKGKAPRLPGDDAPILKVFVRLRNGIEPAESWPSLGGRNGETRWGLTNDPFDITHWRPA